MAKSKNSAQVYQLKITLRDIKPPVWRQVQVKDCTLARLHEIIQTSMGWRNYHLHAFQIGGQEYGPPDPDGMLEMNDERKFKLGQFVRLEYKKFSYTYDFGDGWEHIIQIEKTLEAAPGVRYPRCVAGKRACPPEDCGGAWGYGDFLKAISDPKHEQHQELLEWIGGAFDPEAFDVETINKALCSGSH